jgi:hypothetical protein
VWRSNTTLTPSDSETRKLHTGSHLEASMIVVSLQQIDEDNDALDSRWQIEEALDPWRKDGILVTMSAQIMAVPKGYYGDRGPANHRRPKNRVVSTFAGP